MCIVAPSGNFCREAAIARASCPIGAVVPLGPTVREPCGLSRQPSEICTLPPCSHLQRARARERAPCGGRSARHLGLSQNPCHTRTPRDRDRLRFHIPAVGDPPDRSPMALANDGGARSEGREASGAGRWRAGVGFRRFGNTPAASGESIRLPTAEFQNDVMSSVFHSELPPSTARRRSLVRSGFEFDFAPVAARAFLLELPWLACSTWFNGCARTVQWKQYWKHTTRRTRSESACASAQIACSAIEAGRLASSSSCSRAHVVFCLWQVPPSRQCAIHALTNAPHYLPTLYEFWRSRERISSWPQGQGSSGL